jgi:hypothetical protein
MALKQEMMDEIRDVQELWSRFAIVLGIAIILTAWLPTDLSAGSKGPAFGKADATGISGINKSPQEPTKVRNYPTDSSASGGNDRGIIIVSGKGEKDASTRLDAKKIQQGIKINPGGPVELNPQPLPPKAFQRSIKINPGDAVGLKSSTVTAQVGASQTI